MLGSLLGQGRTAEVYSHGEQASQVVKLFYDWCGRAEVEQECEISVAVAASGFPAPQVGGLVQLRGRHGIIYQRVAGENMLQRILFSPEHHVRYARQLAAVQASMHRTRLSRLPRQRAQLISSIRRAGLSAGTKSRVLALLDELPDGESLCHGDYHPGNVIVSNGHLTVIDWANATSGHPLADVARTSLLLTIAEIPGLGAEAERVKLWQRVFRDAYVEHYLQLTGYGRKELERWRLPVAAARLAENLPGEDELIQGLLSE
ncbi:MAG: phosphotransferase [Bacillota bacterium]